MSAECKIKTEVFSASGSESGADDFIDVEMERMDSMDQGDSSLQSVLEAVQSVQPVFQQLIALCQSLQDKPGPERDEALRALKRMVEAHQQVQQAAQQLLDQNRKNLASLDNKIPIPAALAAALEALNINGKKEHPPTPEAAKPDGNKEHPSMPEVTKPAWSDVVVDVREITQDGFHLDKQTITCRAGGCINITARNVRFTNVTIRSEAQAATDGALVHVCSGASVIMEGCRVEDSAGVGVHVEGELTARGKTAIVGSRLDNLRLCSNGKVTMQDSELQGSREQNGVVVWGPTAMFTAVRNVMIHGNATSGVWVRGGKVVTEPTTVICDNRGCGVAVEDQGAFVASGTTLSGNAQHNVLVKGKGSAVNLTDCKVQHSRHWCGVSVEGGGTFTAQGTEISRNNEHNLRVSDTNSSATLTNCRVLECTRGCGGLVEAHGRLEAYDTMFSHNHLSNVEIQEQGRSVIRNCLLNHSRTGRGVLVHSHATLRLDYPSGHQTFTGNHQTWGHLHQCKYDWERSTLVVNGEPRRVFNAYHA